ncbi:MAG TPA: nucleoside triphosphate pyrophosphatase [Candidatus Aquilonibacter sp.]|nr:nucleoside triphosphate pyrophosphatase [Candidatus Aquilonibacter sp.]
MRLILASGSPRRAEILRNAGFSFEVCPAHVDESLRPNESAAAYVLRLAESKAESVAGRVKPPDAALVMGADTTVVCAGEILGKPGDAAEAVEMLRKLSGAAHEVLTGLAIINTLTKERALHVETTRVTFLALSPEEIDRYIATGEPFDKAGGYGIQGIGGRFVSRIEGCYFNVMGLPLSKTWQMLRQVGWRE